MAASHPAPAAASPSRYFGSAYPEWTPERAEQIAGDLGLRLRAAHWRVLGCARELWVATRAPLDRAALTERTGLDEPEIVRLFREPLEERLRAIAGLDE